MTKVLITGGQGLVARALLANKPDRAEVFARSRLQLDIRDRSAVGAAIGELAPDVVINAAAFTACDLAETEIDHAHAVNAQGVANLAEACRAKAHAMVERDERDQPVMLTAPTSPYERRLFRLAFLAPEIQQAILAGRQPRSLNLEQMINQDLPIAWSKQRRMLGFSAC
jgi:RmlD substrate binding domain